MQNEQGKNGEFYTRDNVVWKSPIYKRNETDDGDVITVGFPVCTASEWIDAETIAGILTEYEASNKKRWRCFHCDDVFTTEHAARLHFGATDASEPACKIKMGAEGSLVTALRRAEGELADAWAAIHNESTEAAKAYYSQQSRHQEQLRATEELGFERGLAAGREEYDMACAEANKAGYGLCMIAETIEALAEERSILQSREEKSKKAIAYLLNRFLRDDKLYYQIGYGTEAFRLLTDAYAAMTGENVDEVERRYGR